MKKIALIIALFSIATCTLWGQEDTTQTQSNHNAVATDTIQNSIDVTSVLVDSVKKPNRKDYWKFSGIAGLNFSQVGIWNWAAGGNNNAAGRVFANLTLTYKRGKIGWDSNLDTEFGVMWTPETQFRWRVPNDKIVFSSKFGVEFSKSWFVTILSGFKSQYYKGYEYKIANGTEEKHYVSNLASPSYTDLSVGIDWKPNTIFTVYYSPVAGRITTCTDSILRSKYGVPIDKNFTSSLGMTLKAGVNYSPKKVPALKIISTVTFYTPYTSQVQKFGNIDVDWDFSISYQFLKVLNVSLNTALKYYDQVMITDKKGHTSAKVQFKEIVSLGLAYSF
ncbi:MAG: DUF3078 domain-containing protein [Bacteroidales bacterium]|jgi:hypothetical protein|nr:DUF3078 domain-containing protein [Bacteroidales bacterium]